MNSATELEDGERVAGNNVVTRVNRPVWNSVDGNLRVAKDKWFIAGRFRDRRFGQQDRVESNQTNCACPEAHAVSPDKNYRTAFAVTIRNSLSTVDYIKLD